MCDTIVALPEATKAGCMLFGKNSDRQRNEAHSVEYLPRVDHPPDASVRCTYIGIPQERRTQAVLLCRPFWIWGAEMGANEHGVVIGNEGLFSRSPPPEEPALTGMDLLRLGLERSTTAAEAVTVITGLLSQFGQGGNCGHITPSYYQNGFMVADSREAFVLETVGKEWVVERVRSLRAISNEYSIRQEVEDTSPAIHEVLRKFGWQGEGLPNYSDFLKDWEKSHIGSAQGRQARATSLLRAGEGDLSLADIISILRDHDPTGEHEAEWDPKRTLPYSLCIHASTEDRGGQTTGSMVSEIGLKDSIHWVTGTAAPCISIFKPVLLDGGVPKHGPRATDQFDSKSLWWRHERLHRTALTGDFTRFVDDIRCERDALEAEFHARVTDVLNGGSTVDRLQVVTDCWKKAIDAEVEWFARIGETVPDDDTYNAAWREMNRLAGMEEALTRY